MYKAMRVLAIAVLIVTIAGAGAVLYGIGSRKKWMHSVFHIFVVLGSVLQFFAVLLYAI